VVSARAISTRGPERPGAHESEWHVEAKLVIVGGEDASRQFELRLPSIIGRSRSTDITLGHPLISRHHCEVFEAAGRLMLRDLGSLNGTFVGDSRLSSEPIALQPGEQFSLGPVTLQAEYRATEEDAGKAADERSSAAGWQPGGPTVDSPLADLQHDASPDDEASDADSPNDVSGRSPGNAHD